MHVQIYRIEAPVGFFQSQIHAVRHNDIHDGYVENVIQMVSKWLLMWMMQMTMTTMKMIQTRTMNSNQRVIYKQTNFNFTHHDDGVVISRELYAIDYERVCVWDGNWARTYFVGIKG